MSDFIVDGAPAETPINSANQSYAATPPTFGRTMGALFGEESTVGAISRQNERLSAEGFGPIQYNDTYVPPAEDFKPEGPKLPAEDINKLYAPEGTSITDHPMSDALGKIVGQQKQEEMDREGILARAAQSRSVPAMFGMGIAAFIADPLNLASTFLPGIGEETALSGLARVGMATQGVAARTTARLAAGATAGVVGQAPLTALRYGLGQQQASDYDLRSAMKDVAFAAAGGAILHAVFGAAGDALRARRTTPGQIAEPPGGPEGGPPGAPPGSVAAEAAPILNASAETRDAAMRSSVSQVATGRPVDIAEVFGETPEYTAEGDIVSGETPQLIDKTKLNEALPPEPTRLATWIKNRGGIKDDEGEVEASLGAANRRPGLINGQGESSDDLARAAWEAGYFPEYQERPPADKLIQRLHDDLNGVPQYSDHFSDELESYRQALGRKSEIGEYAAKFGLPTEGVTRSQFWDSVAERMSAEDHAKEISALDEARSSAMAEAEKAARVFVESRGDEWEPDVFYDHGQPRTEADLEREYAQDAGSTRPLGRPSGAGEPGPAAGSARPLQEGAGQGGRAIGSGGRGGAVGIDTAAIAQRQQQLYRTGFASGLTGDELLKAENELLGEKEAPQEGASAPKPRTTPNPDEPSAPKTADPELDALEKALAERQGVMTAEERADLEQTAAGMQRANSIEDAALQAVQCLIEGGA